MTIEDKRRVFYQRRNQFVVDVGGKEILEAEDILPKLENLKKDRELVKKGIQDYEIKLESIGEYIKELEKFVSISEKILKERNEQGKKEREEAWRRSNKNNN